jgi:tripartite-type tricarboxylate transporter receptor subunit TctC
MSMIALHSARRLAATLGVVLSVIALSLASPAVLAAFPDRPLHLIVPFPPGGPNDIIARLVGQKLSERIGQPVIVENHPGASTIIGTQVAAKAEPDGYTLLMVSPSHVINPGLRASMPYDLLRDFVPVIEVANSPNVLVTNGSLPVESVKDLLALAKTRPGEINYGSGGNGTATHLAGVLLSQMGGVSMNHVPYKGDAPATTDLLGGRISWMFGTILSVKPFIDAGRLKAIAVSGSRRSAVLPNVPSVAETLPGFEATSLYGIVAPASTPPEIVTRLNAELQKVITAAEFRERLSKDGTEVVGGEPAAFGVHLKQAIDKWTRVIRDAGIKPE